MYIDENETPAEAGTIETHRFHGTRIQKLPLKLTSLLTNC